MPPGRRLAGPMNDVEPERRLDHSGRPTHVERERSVFEPLDHLTSTKATQVTARLR